MVYMLGTYNPFNSYSPNFSYLLTFFFFSFDLILKQSLFLPPAFTYQGDFEGDHLLMTRIIFYGLGQYEREKEKKS